jgi:hypothetical protein
MMSASVEMKEIPSWTILQVNLADHGVFIEAWAKEELDKAAIRSACERLREGDVVLLEAKDSHSDRRVCGQRRIALLELREAVESGRPTLVLQMGLRKLAKGQGVIA